MTEQRNITLTEDDLRRIVSESVKETLTRIGVDADDPLEMQKDFQHLREWRETTQSVKAKGLLAVVTLLVSGTAAALWMGFKEMIVGR